MNWDILVIGTILLFIILSIVAIGIQVIRLHLRVMALESFAKYLAKEYEKS